MDLFVQQATRRRGGTRCCLALLATVTALAEPGRAARPDGMLHLEAVDEQTGQPIPVRLELRDARGRQVRLHTPGSLTLQDGLYFDGTVTLPLRKGGYRFVLEAGPEFQTRPGTFDIERRAEDFHRVALRRRVDMRAEGWFAVDCDVALPPPDAALAMRARGIDAGVVVDVVNDRGRCQQLPLRGQREPLAVASPPTAWHGAVDRRDGGTLLFAGRSQAFPLCQFAAPDQRQAALAAVRSEPTSIVAADPRAWDLPLWLAEGAVDAVQVLHRESDGRRGEPTPWRRPIDPQRFPGKTGEGLYAEAVYHHVLNCGFRLPPVAGSGAGQSPDPVGCNRVYAFCGASFSAEQCWSALRSGHTVVTNGPLLRPEVDGHPPGRLFTLQAGETREFRVAVKLAFYEARQVAYLELLQNGRAVHQIRLADLAARGGRLPSLQFAESGWFAVRAVTDNPEFYQLGVSAPYYVDAAGGGPRIERRSVAFFRTWLDDAERQFAGDPACLDRIARARTFWDDLEARATD